MNIQIIFAILSSVVGIVCFIPYIRDIFRHKTKPHSYTWLVWTILQVTGVIAMFNGGAGIGIASLAIGATFCVFIFLLSLNSSYGTHNIKPIDTICLIGALIAITIYIFLQDALLAVIFVAIIDFIGFMPTIRKAYEEPYSETASTYVLSSVSCILALGALTSINFTTSLYLISLIITNATCALIIFIRRK